MTELDLLAPVIRWTRYRKYRLVRAVAAGRLKRETVLSTHNISPEEWEKWNADLNSEWLATMRRT